MAREPREFDATVLEWKAIRELPDGWPTSRLLSLLSALDVDDVSESDALDMTLMALQDLDPDEAADHVLDAVFGSTMRRGVRENLAHDLIEDRPWEDFPELAQQAGIFEAVVLLQRAFPREYSRPGAVSIVVRLETGSERARSWLDAAPSPDAALLLRILASGMDGRAVLRRLFGDSLAATAFPQAAGILWRVARRDSAGPAREFELISSHPWFDPLQDVESWTATAWPDTTPAARG